LLGLLDYIHTVLCI